MQHVLFLNHKDSTVYVHYFGKYEVFSYVTEYNYVPINC